jgi:hypothetical protein
MQENSPVSIHSFILLLNAVEVTLGIIVLFSLIRAREMVIYWPLLIMAMWQSVPYFTLLFLRNFGLGLGIKASTAYIIYFYTFWPMFAVSAIASIVLTYTIFDGAMTPLKGLQSLGKIMYRWAASISIAIAISIAVVPSTGDGNPIIVAVSQLQRASAILILSLVTFVVFAIRPMGLSLRSRVFGASIGTMIVAATNMFQASFLNRRGSMYNIYAVIQLLSGCIAACIWLYYFALPEPKRKFILLPTTSPFHRWNQISELLGHDPGYVAIGGIPPDAFAAAEIEVFHRASAKMNALGDSTVPAPRLDKPEE